MSKMQVLETLVGEQVSLICKDREETEFNGELLDLSDLGVTIKYSSHGREFIDWIPMDNLWWISYKVLDTK